MSKKYIDADAIGIGKCNPDAFEDKGYANGWNSAIKIINDAPAADVQEVRHGRWVYNEWKGWHCSECGNQAPFWCLAATQKLANYCQDCGAKMDLSTDEILKMPPDDGSTIPKDLWQMDQEE